MIFFVYAAENDGSIDKKLGAADYSYFFVMKTFLPVLRQFGRVEIIKRLSVVDLKYAVARLCGEPALLLSFTPPHKTPTGLRCPTIPVFAWEYSTIPNESWANDWRHDWARVLADLRGAITHSTYAVSAVQQAVSHSYRIASLPAPLWDKFAELYQPKSDAGAWEIDFNGVLLDSHVLGLRTSHAIDAPPFAAKSQRVRLGGVVYTAVFNPNDGRKNWSDMLSAFCFAFRDQPNVTLVMKLAFFDSAIACGMVLSEMKKNAPYQCRVVAIQGYLDGDAYRQLVKGTTYIVNSSYGEGQCLPLMEFMSAGKPAIAPDHSGMADYINTDNAFVVKSSREWTHWPHDPRLVLRAFRHRIDWGSLRDAFLQSFRLAVIEPERYVQMAASANLALKHHCSHETTSQRLIAFVNTLGIALEAQAGPRGSWCANLLKMMRRATKPLKKKPINE